MNKMDFLRAFGKRIEEFQYEYRTDKAGYCFLRNLAHIYFQIPYSPDKWRGIKLKESENAEV